MPESFGEGIKKMLQFWIALFVFLASHSVISRTGLRPFLVARLGERHYLLFYSLLSLVLLFWVFAASLAAPRVELWPWHHAYYWLPNIAMPVACIFFMAGLLRPNPLSIMGRRNGFNPARPPVIVAVTRHPVLWGFFLWAGSHILPNGEFPLAFLFAVFALFALAGTKLIDRKRRRQMGAEQWESLAANTANFPLTGKGLWQGRFTLNSHDAAAIGAGLGLYIILYSLHPVLFHILPAPPL